MIEQLDIFEPPAQRHSATSRAAAERIKDDTPTLREMVRCYIRDHGPVTDEQIAFGLAMNPSTARPRRIELVAEGLVRAHYEAGKTSSGRSATLWVAV